MQRLVTLSFAAAGLVAAAFGCKNRDFNAQKEAGVETSHVTGEATGTRKHLLITPTGKRIFDKMVQWYQDQPDDAAMPAQCARNVSDVLLNTDGRFGRYCSVLIPEIKQQVTNAGGKVIILPPKDLAGIKSKLNASFPGGRIPTGAMVAGCYSGPTCEGEAGDGHIALVGDLNSDGAVQLYHNNWWRPENNGGVWLPGMVSRAMLNAGHKRQWMPTSWYRFTFANNQVSDLYSTLPQIDDLDPMAYSGRFPGDTRDGGRSVTVMIMVIPEILNELNAGNYQTDSTAGPAATCSADTATSRMCIDQDVDVFNGAGNKVGVAKPWEPVCRRNRTDAQGKELIYFPMPPSGEAWVPNGQANVCDCNMERLNACLRGNGGAIPCAKRECSRRR